MSIEDQDEEIEEEEEFHEVDEEKHKTSQESVSTGQNKSPPVLENDDATNEPTIQNDPQPSGTSEKEAEDAKAGDGGTHLETVPEPQEASESATTISPPPAPASEPEASKTDATPSVEESKPAQSTAVQPETKPTIDWANIMLSSRISSKNSDRDSNDGEPHSDSQSNGTTSIVKSSSQDNTMDEIVAITREKLHIYDDLSTDGPPQRQDDSKLESDVVGADDTVTAIDNDEASKRTTESSDLVDGQGNSVSDEQSKSAVDGTDRVDADSEKKELDMDEDVKNPQYIPKKGIFYEHDDRSHDVEAKSSPPSATVEDGTEAVKMKDANSSKKTSVQEKQNDNRRNNNRRQRTDADKWNHDLFRDDRQKPKSKSELINAYGYDIRQERASGPTDSRAQRGPNTSQGGQEDHRSRTGRDSKPNRANQPGNSRERRPRRQNPRTNSRSDNASIQPKRENPNPRPAKSDNKETKDSNEGKQPSQNPSYSSNRRNREPPRDNRSIRNDKGGRRRSSRDPPQAPVEDKPQQANTIMPPITVWTNEDTANAENFKESPPMAKANVLAASQAPPHQRAHTSDWDQGQSNKIIYQDKPNRDENRHNSSRARYQDRSDSHRSSQTQGRNQWNDRSNQHYTEWHRANNANNYGKTNDYIVKTQTFENSRLSQQANLNRSNERDLREVLNARRVNVQQQNFQMKAQSISDQHMQHRGPMQGQHMHNQYAPSHHMVQHHPQHAPQHLVHHHQTQFQQSQQHTQLQHQQGQQQSQQRLPHQQQHPNQSTAPQPHQQQAQPTQQIPTSNSTSQTQPATSSTQQGPNQRPKPTAQPGQSRQNSMPSGGQELNRAGPAVSGVGDMLNSRPIIKTDSYTSSGVPAHQQPAQSIPHSQNHRNIGGPMVQHSPNHAGTHLVPSHLGSAGAAPYYPSNNTRDPTGAPSLATAYHGYMPGAHSMVDTTRYHMTTQQLSEHGYMNPTGQANVPPASVLHQQGMYTDATQASGTVASSAYLAQAGSTLSPNSNIPVTGAGPPPLPPVSYLQHSQYPPPPYSNPYSHQPQHNQAPTQTSHAYPPYWSYIQ